MKVLNFDISDRQSLREGFFNNRVTNNQAPVIFDNGSHRLLCLPKVIKQDMKINNSIYKKRLQI